MSKNKSLKEIANQTPVEAAVEQAVPPEKVEGVASPAKEVRSREQIFEGIVVESY